MVPLMLKTAGASAPIIGKEDSALLFANIEKVVFVHRGLYKNLCLLTERWPFVTGVGQAFLNFAPSLTVYGAYVSNFDNSRATLARLRVESHPFSAALLEVRYSLDSCHAPPSCSSANRQSSPPPFPPSCSSRRIMDSLSRHSFVSLLTTLPSFCLFCWYVTNVRSQAGLFVRYVALWSHAFASHHTNTQPHTPLAPCRIRRTKLGGACITRSRPRVRSLVGTHSRTHFALACLQVCFSRLTPHSVRAAC